MAVWKDDLQLGQLNETATPRCRRKGRLFFLPIPTLNSAFCTLNKPCPPSVHSTRQPRPSRIRG